MSAYGIVFIASVLLIAYAYIGYPLFVWAMAQIAGEGVHPTHPTPRAVSIVLAAYNEAATIQRRVRELLAQIDGLPEPSEVIVVSDGSTDGTDRLAREVGDGRVRVIQQPANMGKALALNAGVTASRMPIIVFADTRQQWDRDTLHELLDGFRDPDVGAVSGDLVLVRDDGSLAGVGLYWKLEKWIRTNESCLSSCVQVSGSICAVRRELYTPLPAGTILDDVYWPLAVAMQGFRVIHQPHAQAFDHLPTRARDEMRRKVRTLAGNFQLVVRQPAVMLPWRNPIWFSLVCHKLLRLVVPWAMVAAMLVSALSREPWLQAMCALQLVGYTVGVAAIFVPAVARNRLANAVSSLLVLNAAALLSWFVYFTGQAGRSWKKATYAPPLGSFPTTGS